jgi:acyl dehydratase
MVMRFDGAPTTGNAVNPGDELTYEVGSTGLGNWNRFAAANNEFVPMHMDDVAARASGFPAAFAMGTLVWAYAHRAIRSWLDGDDRIERVQLRFVAPAFRGHTEVRALVQRDGRHLDLQVLVDDVVVARGVATIREPDLLQN